jgi:hypothetical protein
LAGGIGGLQRVSRRLIAMQKMICICVSLKRRIKKQLGRPRGTLRNLLGMTAYLRFGQPTAAHGAMK